MKVVLPGGSGHLGQIIAAPLVDRGDEVVVLSRRPIQTNGGVRFVQWDGETLGRWAGEIDGCDAIVHLTGQRVDTRATKANIDELISSRVQPVRVVGEAIAAAEFPPAVWVQSSSLAIYGGEGDTIIEEGFTPSGLGPREMVTVCLAWEHAFRLASTSVDRSVVLRTGIGFGGSGDPATKKLAGLVRFGLGGTVGTGDQWISWIDTRDLVRIFLRAIDEPNMRGVYHATGPNPVTNAELMTTFREAMGRSFGLPAPALVARLGAPLLGSSASLALTGRRAVPARLQAEGFRFDHHDLRPTIDRALSQLD